MSDQLQGDPEAGRVRFCAACGEAVAFDRRTCPSCGHHEPLARPVEAGPSEPCPLCGKPASRDLIYCPACGRARQGSEEPAPREADARSEPSQVRGLSALVLALTVAGPLALVAAAAYVLF